MNKRLLKANGATQTVPTIGQLPRKTNGDLKNIANRSMGVSSQLVFYVRVLDQFKRAEMALDQQTLAIKRLYGNADLSRAGAPKMIVRDITVDLLQLPFLEARPGLHKQVLHYTKIVEKLAEQLPVWPWAETIRGVGPLVLGQIVGESGDLSNYSNPAKLWKRMGVGLVDGQRQRRVANNPALAVQMGYSARRRGRVHCLGDALMRQNKDLYRKIYDERKALEAEKEPGKTKMVYHLRALRYMEKKFLKHLWQAWRKK